MTDDERNRILQLLVVAAESPESYVVEMDYVDAKGNQTHRVISPIKFLNTCVSALCLGREEPRRFVVDRMSNVELKPSHDQLMPVKIYEKP